MRNWFYCLQIALIWLLAPGAAQAQQHGPQGVQCVTPELTPAQRAALNGAAEQALTGKKAAGKLTALTYVPIRPHILRATNGTGGFTVASLNSVLASVNSYYLYNGSGIQFYIAGDTPDYIDNDALFLNFPAFNETGVAGRDAANAMNMFFVNQFDQPGLGGYAYFPDNSLQSTRSFILTGSGESNTDLGNRLMPHELGHNFNLYHTFQGSTSGNPAEVELVTRGTGANCTTAGDGLCDTPADPYNRSGSGTTTVNNCPVYNGTATDPNGDVYTPSITNIMSYYFPCTHDFTPGQYDRIQSGLALRQTHTAYSLTYPAAVMAAPGNLTASVSPRGFVQLTWQDNAANETGYFVERATAPGGPFRAVGGVSPNVTTFTDETVETGQTYRYRIRPSNTTTGSLSAELTIAVGGITCQPVYTSGCLGGEGLNGFTINGDKLSEATGCSETGYQEISGRRTTLLSGQTYAFTATLLSGNAQSLTIWADLNHNGQYETTEKLFQTTGSNTITGNLTMPAGQSAGALPLRVMVNAASAGLPTDACGSYAFGETEDYGLSILAACPVPATLTATGLTTGGAQLSWTNGGDGLRYDLQWRRAGTAAWTSVTNLSAATYALTGLQPSTGYDWQVRTLCSVGVASAFSAPATFTTAGSCAPPTSLTAMNPSATRVVLMWTGTGPGVTYTVQWQPAGSSVWRSQSGIMGTMLSLTGLVSSTTYNWQVVTNCGLAGNSAAVNGPAFQTKCLPPVGPVVLAVTTASAQLNWGGNAPFEVQWRLKNTAAWTTISGLTGTTYTLPGLLRGTAYQWQVRAICSPSIPSDWVPGPDFNTAGCRPTFTYNCTYNDGLNSFSLNGIPLSTASGCSVSGYSQFTAATASVRPGQSYTFTATLLSNVFSEGVIIWADANHNDVFEPTEALYQSPGVVSDSLSGSLTIPAGATPGPLALRVMAVYSAQNFDPCGNYSYGEAEDYVLTVPPVCTSLYSVQDGPWSSPATWSCYQVPTATDMVEIRHLITAPAQYSGLARRVTYKAGGRLLLQAGARIKLGF